MTQLSLFDETAFLTIDDSLDYLKALYLRGKLGLKLWDVYVPSWDVERGFSMLYENEQERETLTTHVRALGGYVEDGGSQATCYARGERLWEQIPIREWDAEYKALAMEERRQGLDRLREKAPDCFYEQGRFSMYLYMLHHTGLGRQWKGE